MGIIGTVLKFAKGLNWIRIALIAVIAVLIFGAGYQYSNTKHAEHAADVQKQITKAVSDREKELKAEHAIRVAEEEQAFKDLQKGLSDIESHRDSLIAAIRKLQLTKPIGEIKPEACIKTDDENVQIIIANPFDPSFVELWNDAGRGLPRTGEDAGP